MDSILSPKPGMASGKTSVATPSWASWWSGPQTNRHGSKFVSSLEEAAMPSLRISKLTTSIGAPHAQGESVDGPTLPGTETAYILYGPSRQHPSFPQLFDSFHDASTASSSFTAPIL